MNNHRTDEEIILEYLGGENGAFREIVERYAAPIYNFAARLAGTGNAADLSQEVFIKAWKNVKRFDAHKASFKTWLYAIAKNIIIDFLRKKKEMTFSDFPEEEDFAENIPDENLLPVQILEKLEDAKLLNGLLDQLPVDYKIVLSLHYQENMTFDEIGKVLNKPPNTVKSWHRRAILALRTKISSSAYI